MAGALSRSRKFRYQEGGAVEGDDGPPDEDAYASQAGLGAGAAYAEAPGAFNQSQAAEPDAEEQLASFGVGSREQVTGAFNQAQTARDAATQRQLNLIRAARARIPAAGGIDPRLAIASALLAPTETGTTTEGWSKALSAYGAAKERQQQDALNRAKILGGYDIDEGTADVAGTTADYEILKERLGLGEKAANARAVIEQRRADAAQRAQRDREAQQAREDALAERKRASEEAAQFSSWIGNDKDTGLPIFANRLGQTRLGEKPIVPKPSGGSAGQGTAFQKNVQEYKRIYGVDDVTAANMVRQGAMTTRGYADLVERIKARMATSGKVDADGNITQYTPAELDREAREEARQVADEARRQTATPKVFSAPLAGPDTTAIFNQSTPAPKAAAPSPAPGAVPPRPSAVPPGAKYSPSQKRWWWQENGQWKSGG